MARTAVDNFVAFNAERGIDPGQALDYLRCVDNSSDGILQTEEAMATKSKSSNILVRTGRLPNPEGDVYNRRKILLMTRSQSEKLDQIARDSGKSISRLMREAMEKMFPEIYQEKS